MFSVCFYLKKKKRAKRKSHKKTKYKKLQTKPTKPFLLGIAFLPIPTFSLWVFHIQCYCEKHSLFLIPQSNLSLKKKKKTKQLVTAQIHTRREITHNCENSSSLKPHPWRSSISFKPEQTKLCSLQWPYLMPFFWVKCFYPQKLRVTGTGRQTSPSLVMVTTVSQHCLYRMLPFSKLLSVFLLKYWQHAPDCLPPEGTQNLPAIPKSFKTFKSWFSWVISQHTQLYSVVLHRAERAVRTVTIQASSMHHLQTRFFSWPYIKSQSLTGKHRQIQSRFSFHRIYKTQRHNFYLIFSGYSLKMALFSCKPIWRDLHMMNSSLAQMNRRKITEEASH